MDLAAWIRRLFACLRREGYATGYFGKWHLDGEGKPQWQPARSFGWEDNRFMFNRGHWKKFEIDVSPLLKTGEAPEGWQDLVCLRSTTKPGQAPNWAAAVSERWKLVLSPFEEPWLLDLEEDWKELQNVAKEHPERVGEMAAGLKEWFQRTGDPAAGDEGWAAVFEAAEG